MNKGGFDNWKNKYLYPFGDIAPIPDDQADGKKGSTEMIYDSFATHVDMQSGINQSSFQKLIGKKYQLPFSVVGENNEWLNELQQPLSITIAEIKKDLRKFSVGFPRDKIPHLSHEEERLLKQGNKLVDDTNFEVTFENTLGDTQGTKKVGTGNNLHFLKSVLT